jgi:hypothetical protein
VAETLQIRTCPLCGEKFSEPSLLAHLRDVHENDFDAVTWHLTRALHRLLNRRKLRG